LAEPIPTGLADITHYRPPSSLADKMAYLLAGTNSGGQPKTADEWRQIYLVLANSAKRKK
jgi:hypothetical protein